MTLHLTVDEALRGFLGSPPHRALMRRFGFGDEEVDLVAPSGAGA